MCIFLLLAIGYAAPYGVNLYYIIIKFEAVKGRGDNDYYGSRDLEDIIAIVNGRVELMQELMLFSEKLRKYIYGELSILLEDRLFIEVILGHLTYLWIRQISSIKVLI